MGEKWVSTSAGKHLAKRRKTNTSPEVELRKAIHAAGGRFRLHPQIAKGCTPDFVLPGRRVAVFVDGCFWHGCPEHGRKTPWTGPNAELWAEKMRRNAERDRRSTQVAEEHDWHVVRVWECQVQRDAAFVASIVLAKRAGQSRLSPVGDGVDLPTSSVTAHRVDLRGARPTGGTASHESRSATSVPARGAGA